MKADLSAKKARNAIRVVRLLTAVLFVVWATFLFSRRTAADESRLERRDQIEKMPAAQKDALRRKHERFAKLQPAQKERLRELNRELSADGDAAQLKQIMLSYHDWLMTSLSPGNRSELLRLDPAARIKRIKELKKQEQQRASRFLSLNDYGVTIRWLRDWVIDNEDEILQKISPEHRRRLMHGRLSEGERLHALVGLVLSIGTDRKIRRFPYLPTLKDFDNLADQLSNPARVKLNESDTARDKARQLREWLQRTNSPGRRFRPDEQDVGQEELEEFFRSLSDDDRDRLLSLSVDEFQRQLRFRYLRKQLSQIPRDFRPDSPNNRRPRRDQPPLQGRFRGDGKRASPPRNPNRGPRRRPGFEKPPKDPPKGDKAL